MHGKHTGKKRVRFSHTTIMHSPPTPELSVGSLSPASSAGPLTPPLYAAGLPGPTPYAIPYVAGLKANYVRAAALHPLLRYSTSPIIKFDVSEPPSTISTHRRGLPLSVLSEPATDPPLPCLTLREHHLSWEIRVTAASGAFVTLSDVFECVYRSLRLSISHTDFYALAPHDQRRVTAAYEQRCRRKKGSPEYAAEKSRGVRRVDFLQERTFFMGLSSPHRGSDAWILHVS